MKNLGIDSSSLLSNIIYITIIWLIKIHNWQKYNSQFAFNPSMCIHAETNNNIDHNNINIDDSIKQLRIICVEIYIFEFLGIK